MNFFQTPFFLPWLYPTLVWRMSTHEKKVYLTFDDGPVPGATEFVLDTLRQYDAVATFFCIGDNVRKHPQVFAKIVEAGHAVGNHTFHHLKGWNTALHAYLKNIDECEATLTARFAESGRQGASQLFRPPYGRITRAQINGLKERYKIIMWDVLTQDYAQNMTPDKCLQGTIRASRPGSVVVFHDSYKAQRNMMFALPRYLEFLSAEGYAFGVL